LINEIKREFKLANSEEAEKVFDIWKENNLISICAWNNEMFEIGAVLKDEYYKIDDEDIIWKDWIKDRNIELKPESEELKNYLNELPF
ncbi:MAG: hypothetical protein KDC47_11510, partial [Flavobacteriaceae bacterium]|nr:hypothetical protein [Flavobacteriaceae bacterium]